MDLAKESIVTKRVPFGELIGVCWVCILRQIPANPRSHANNTQKRRFSDQKIDNNFHVEYLFHFV